MENVFDNERLDAIKVLRILFRNYKLIAFAVVLGAIGAIVVTFFIAPKYYSIGIVYPTYSNSPDQNIENPQFGYEGRVDQLMQLLESEVIRDSVIKMYNLIDYYELDTSQISWEHNLNRYFTNDVTFFRSKYTSIVITATTKDADLSANIVNSIINMVDGVREAIYEENRLSAVKASEEKFLSKQREVWALEDSIYRKRYTSANNSLQLLYEQYSKKKSLVNENEATLLGLKTEYQFVDLNEQLNDLLIDKNSVVKEQRAIEGRLTVLKKNAARNDTLIQHLEGLYGGNESKYKYLNERIDELGKVQKRYNGINNLLLANKSDLDAIRLEYEDAANNFIPTIQSPELIILEQKLAYKIERLEDLQNDYENVLGKYNAPFPKIYKVNMAKPSDRKASPSYRFNVFIGGAGAFIVVLFFLIFRVKFKQIKAQVMAEEA